MRYFKKVEGDRLYLSPINLDDVEKYIEWLSDPEVSIPLGNSAMVFTTKNEREFLEKLASGEHAFSIVKKGVSDNGELFVRDGDVLIGNCGIFDINHIHQTATVGLFIGDRENRGVGYGTETLKLLLSYGFKILNLHNIMLTVFSFNSAGLKSYNKVGFKEFGRRKEAIQMNGKRFDIVYMQILSSEFESDTLSKHLPI
ncbi:GNAT family N-acetyltransferase [bacterium]|nr:GNAT family N-acetyltransferase [bacterium]